MAQAAAAVKQANVTDVQAVEEEARGLAAATNTEIADAQTELLSRLQSYRSAHLPAKGENVLNNRYQIDVNRQLDYGYTHAKAYAALDPEIPERPVIAVVCDPYHPHRSAVLEKMKNLDHPYMITVVDAGVVKLSNLKQERYVILFEKPKGKTLAEMLREGLKLNEQQAIQQIIKPLCQALMFFEENGISHLRVNPENIFIGDTLTLGDPSAEPGGVSQPFFYEPVERLICSAYGKGEGSIRTDIHAVGVIVAEVLYGLEKQKQLSKEAYTSVIVQHGAQGVILGNRTHTEYFQDFFRGTMSDQVNERWYASSLRSWVGGKRFNLLNSNAQREALRAIEFKGKEFHNRRALASAFYENWEEARHFVPDAKLPRWLEQSLLKPDLANRLAIVIENFKAVANKSERHFNDLLARTIIILDPQGPIRLNKIALYPDGIGPYVSQCFHREMHAELSTAADIVMNDLCAFWSELQTSQSAEQQEMTWRIQKIRTIINNHSTGMGMERCLYELNPLIPCQSHLTREYHVTNLQQLLHTLDAIAPLKDASHTLQDRHLAAYLTAKLGLFRDQKSFELKEKAELMGNQELKVIRLLAKAQGRMQLKLSGLTLWAGLRILNMMEHVHSRRFRKNITSDIRKYADEGRIAYILQVFFNEKMLVDDNNGFVQAWSVYHRNKIKIQQFKNRDFIKKMSDRVGYRLSSLIGTMMLLYSLYYAFKRYVI